MNTIRDTEQVVMLSVVGMTCGSCVRRVEAALVAVDGVHDAQVDLGNGRVAVRYDPTVAEVAPMIDAVQGAGYQARLATEDRRASLPIRSGCGCGGCA